MWVLIVLGAIILLIALLLCVPVNIVFSWNSAGTPKANITLVWLFGLVSVRPGGKKGKKQIVEVKKKPSRRLQIRKAVRIISVRGLAGRVSTFLCRLWRRIKIKELNGDFKLELEDPAEAGFICGVLGAISPLLRSYPLNQFKIEPVLDGGIAVRGRARAVIAFLPVSLVIPSLRFVFSRPVLQAARISLFEKA